MPGFDRSGPEGNGPMTGRSRGWCASARPDQSTTTSLYSGLGNQYGFGRRGNRGGGMGRGRKTGAFSQRQAIPGEQMQPEREIEALRSQVERLQRTIDSLLQQSDKNQPDQ